MIPPRSRTDGLWRALATAQDDALARSRGLDEASETLTARVSGPDGHPTLSGRVRQPKADGWRGAWVWRASLGLGAAAVVAIVIGVIMPGRALRFRLGPEGERGAPGRTLVADARSDLPLRFSDGSQVTFQAGAVGRVERLTEAGAEVVLERGTLEAQVVHTRTTRWIVHAGPYRVRVTGTRFSVTWSPTRLGLSLFEGSVTVEGALLGTGLALRAGQRLTIADGVVRTEPLARPPVAGAKAIAATNGDDQGASATKSDGTTGALATVGGPVAARAPTTPGLSTRVGGVGSLDGEDALAEGDSSPGDDGDANAGASDPGAGLAPTRHPRHRRLAAAVGADAAPPHEATGAGPRTAPGAATGNTGGTSDERWLRLADQGAYREAFAAAGEQGWSRLCARLDARRLLVLGDVARYAGSDGRARKTFRCLVRRFGHDRLASDAVFSLGRLAFESGRPNEAQRWFGRYLSQWPNAPLAEQASGRLVECAIRQQNEAAAARAAHAYLARFPNGPHASLAGDVLRDSRAEATSAKTTASSAASSAPSPAR